MTLFSRLRMLVNINSWCEATWLILNVSMGSSVYLTKCLRFILYSFLLLIITPFCCYLRYIYEKNLYLMAFLSLRVDSINIKGNFLQFVRSAVFLFIFIMHISYIISAFWRYRSKSRSRSRLLEHFFLLSLELK